jgi:type I restriction enzyme S subunit
MSTWQTVNLGHVAQLIRGINFKPEDVVPAATPGSVACMRTKNVQTQLDLSDVWSVSEEFVKRGDQFLQPGDVLVSSANSWNLVGKCCWVPALPMRTTFGGFVSVLRPNQDKIEPRYLYNWFASPRIQATLRSFGQQTTNISNLNTERCLRLPLPLPPLPEQKRIAEILDRAEALRAKRRAALAELDTLLDSIIAALFGDLAENPKKWPASPLGDLCEKVIDCPHATPVYEESRTDYACIRSSDIQNAELCFNETKYVNESEYNFRIGRGRPQVGDIVYCREGARFGNAALIRSPSPLICLGQRMMLFRADNNVAVSDYVWAFLSSSAASRQAANLVGGSAAPHINIRDINKFSVPLPPLFLQHEFARRAAAVEKLKAAHRKSLAELDALFASLQHRAFRGEL